MHSELPEVLPLVNDSLHARVQHLLDSKTKPLGSLGTLEPLALRIACILDSEKPVLVQPQIVVFAGDHGLAAQGVSAYPVDVTWQMIENFLAGGAAVSVLAKQNGLALNVVDCGVARDLAPRDAAADSAQLIVHKVAYGTQDSSLGPAMSEAECTQAIRNGIDVVRSLPGNAILLGEMGIGNTSAASLLLARLCDLDVGDVTGAGTGLDASGISRKVTVLRQVLECHADVQEPLLALAALGGLEVATMVGAVLQAAHERRVIVVDGFITTAAVLVASRLRPHVLERCVFSHRSGEMGHSLMLESLHAQPLLDMGLRLGEGSGAALAWPLLEAACAILRDMASFSTASVDGKLA